MSVQFYYGEVRNRPTVVVGDPLSAPLSFNQYKRKKLVKGNRKHSTANQRRRIQRSWKKGIAGEETTVEDNKKERQEAPHWW